MSGARSVAKTRVYVSFAAALGSLAAAILIGLVGGKVTGLPERIAAAGDAYTLSAAPTAWTGDEHVLVAGGSHGGAAITYLKFDVTLPEDRMPRRAWLWLGVDRGPLPDLVELTQVPDTSWLESSVTATDAPRLGNVVASVFTKPDAPAVAFDVTKVVRSSGVYAFAVTAPTSTELARFVAREAIRTATGAPTITLEWSLLPTATSTLDASLAAASSEASVAPTASAEPTPSNPWQFNAPPFTPVPREIVPPVVQPWPSVVPALTKSAAFSTPSPSISAPAPYVSPTPHLSPTPWASASPSARPSASASPTARPSSSPSASPSASPSSGNTPVECVVSKILVPTCGALWGVAPGAHTSRDREDALQDFEELAAKPQMIYHAYMRGEQLFPTADQIALARDPKFPRLLFLNWKPVGATWGQIARGDARTDAYLSRLAEHIKRNFLEQFFFTMHHEPENEVEAQPGSGMTAKDYAAAFRYVVKRLRGEGVSNLVTTVCYMAYVPWNVKSWFEDLYPGDDVVDWVSWDIYAYSDPGYGFGDFAEMMNRRSGGRPGWPGFYNWAAVSFPDKPLMVAEWGVWYSDRNPDHHADFFNSARLQLELFPRVKAYVYFETPNAEGRDSRVHSTTGGLRSFQRFSDHPAFDVKLPRRQVPGREVSPWSEEAPTPRP